MDNRFRQPPRQRAMWLALAALWIFFAVVRPNEPMCVNQDMPCTGMVATGLLDGPASSIWEYQPRHITGAMLFGVLLYPAYRVAGPAFLWVKLLSLAFVAGAVMIWTLTIRRAWGATAAWCFALLAVLPPPFVAGAYHQTFALHVESLLFTGLMAYLLVRGSATAPSFAARVTLGATAGAAVFFCEANVIAAAAAMAAFIWRWRRQGLVWLLAPTALGFLPIAALMHWLALLPFAQHGPPDWQTLTVDCWRRWRALFGRILPIFADYRWAWISVAWTAIALLGGAAAAVRRRDLSAPAQEAGALSRFLALQFGFFVLAYGYSDYGDAPGGVLQNVRYLIPVMFTLAAFFAYALASRPPWLRWPALAFFLAASLAPLAADPTWTAHAVLDRWRAFRQVRGDDYRQYIDGNFARNWVYANDGRAAVERLPPRWRAEGRNRFGWWLMESHSPAALRGEYADEAAQLDVVRGAGRACAHAHPARLAEPRDFATLPKKAAEALAAGAGEQLWLENDASRPWNEIRGAAAAIRANLPQLNDREYAAALMRGVAKGQGQHIFSDMRAVRPLADVDVEWAVQHWRNTLGLADAPALRDAFREGYADGFAVRIKNEALFLRFDPEAAELRGARARLAGQGVRLERRAGTADVFDVSFSAS